MATITQNRLNLATNPSMETASGTVTVRTNLIPNPSFEVNTTGYGSAGTNGATLARDTSVTLFGSASLKTTWGATGNGLVESTGGTGGMAATAGQIYTMSPYLWMANGAPRAVMSYANFYTAAGAWISTVYGSTVNSVLSQWVRLSVTATAPANTGYMSIGISYGSAVAATDVFNTDGVLVEQSLFLLPYFDGARPANYALSATVTSSVAGTNLQRLTDGINSDNNSYAQIPDGNYGWVQVDLGRVTVLDSIKVWHYYSDGRTYHNTKTEVSVDGVTWTAVFDSAVSGEYAEPTNGSGRTTTFSSQGVRYIRDWVNGSTANTGDHWLELQAFSSTEFTYAWSGTANASTSLQLAPAVVSINGGFNGAVVYQSSAYAASGTKSLRITPTVVNNDTPATGIGGEGIFTLGMTAGNTYTFSATINLPVAQTGTMSPKARMIDFVVHAPAGYTEYTSAAAPNAAGAYRLSVTVAIPSNADQAFIRLYNGASAGNGDVWWDSLLLEQSSVLGTYFDGNTATASPPGYSPAAALTYSWTGPNGASTSVETLTKPLQNYQVQAPDSTILGAGTQVGLLEIVGLRGTAVTRSADTDRAGVDGMVPGMSFLTARTVAIKWLISNPAGVEAALQLLAQNWQNTVDPSSIVMTARDYLLQQAGGGSRLVSAVQVQLPGRAAPLMIFGKPGKLDPPVNSAYQFGWLEVASEWFVPDGKVYDSTLNVATTTLPTASGGGAKFAWTFPVNFGPSTGGTLQVANGGLYAAKPVFKIMGPVTNPRVMNPATGQFIRVNLSLGSGDVLVIDTDSRVVRLNGANRNLALDTGSSFFSIPPGGTSLSFASTDGGAVAGSITAYTLNTYSAA